MHLKPFGHVEPLMEHGPNILLEGEMIKEGEKDLQKLCKGEKSLKKKGCELIECM